MTPRVHAALSSAYTVRLYQISAQIAGAAGTDGATTPQSEAHYELLRHVARRLGQPEAETESGLARAASFLTSWNEQITGDLSAEELEILGLCAQAQCEVALCELSIHHEHQAARQIEALLDNKGSAAQRRLLQTSPFPDWTEAITETALQHPFQLSHSLSLTSEQMGMVLNSLTNTLPHQAEVASRTATPEASTVAVEHSPSVGLHR